MREPAKLTADLLARRGQALPTTGFGSPSLALAELLPAPDKSTLRRYATAAANDAGPDHPRRVTARDQRRPPAGPRAEERVALTLRLDRERHRRLRIFSARHEATSQDVIVRALDAYLDACGDDCPCLRGEPEDCIRN